MRHVYVHVPFCKRRCSYCDFAIAVRRTVPGRRFVEAVKREFGRRRDEFAGAEEKLETLYLGGGTPSMLEPPLVAELVDFFRGEVGFADDPEITIEANPDDVLPATADAWLAAGVNRVSLGLQSLRPRVLEWMHRPHAAADGLRAIEVLERAAMPAVSVDIIFALPARLGGDPVSDVERVLQSKVDHVSAYGLTVESGTPLAKWVDRGSTRLVPDADYADQFLRLNQLLTGAGFEHYEVSNYARPGHRSRHNRAYWTGHAYLGLGPSAHSFLRDTRWWNVRAWAAYDKIVAAGADPREGSERLSDGQRRLERAYLGLRTREGVRIEDVADSGRTVLESAISAGWVNVEGGRVRVTPSGWVRFDALVASLTTSGEGG